MVPPLDPSIFKAYDIRGIYGEQIDGDLAQQIGASFAGVLARLADKPASALKVGLGRDMRLSAPALAERYRDGLLSEGVNVLDAGQVGTEMLYHLVGSRQLDGGLMCTASHNPKAYTGAKLVREGALAISEQDIQAIRQDIEARRGQAAEAGGQAVEAGAQAAASGHAAQAGGQAGKGGDTRKVGDTRTGKDGAAAASGSYEQLDIYAEFHAAVSRFIDPHAMRPMKLVLDGGNGMAGPMVGPLLDGLGLELVKTYWTPDGSFPDHEPNPLLPENRSFVVEKVQQTSADLGIAWDGDADRCFFIDEHGDFVDGDFLTALLAQSLLAKQADARAPEVILYDVRASRAVADVVHAAGGIAQVNRVGHAFFKRRMRSEGALFGGEVSGHYYFRDFYCADSGSIPALLVLDRLAREGKPLSQLLAPLRERYFISGEINSEVADQQAKMEQIAARYADGKQQWIDGISVDYDDWHFNVRPSNTEPLLRLCLESLVSRADMERRRDEVLELIRA